MLKDEWKLLPENVKSDEFSRSIAIVAIRKRYIFIFGGRAFILGGQAPHQKYPIGERVGRIDTYRLGKGIEELMLQSVHPPGLCYATIIL